MKGKINGFGYLQIERGGSHEIPGGRLQGCPFGTGSESCGDWCPLFGEPEPYCGNEQAIVVLEICKKKLVFDEFVDERGA